jgi:hypothetical protein
MPIFHWDLEQGSAAWYQARAGIPTASNFHRVMTPKTRKLSTQRYAYAAELILQRILNWQPDSLDKIGHIAEGKANEPLAVAKMELVFEIESRAIGFVTTDDGRFGASPDRISRSGDRVIEVKSPTPLVQMQRLLFSSTEDYYPQRQGQLFVAEADKALFFSFNPRMPDVFVEDGRDETFLLALRGALEEFSDELEAWHEKAKSLGAYQAFPALVTPLDAERGAQRLADATMSEEAFDNIITTSRLG